MVGKPETGRKNFFEKIFNLLTSIEHTENYLKSNRKYNFLKVNIFSGSSPTQLEFGLGSATEPGSFCPTHSKPKHWDAEVCSKEKVYLQGS